MSTAKTLGSAGLLVSALVALHSAGASPQIPEPDPKPGSRPLTIPNGAKAPESKSSETTMTIKKRYPAVGDRETTKRATGMSMSGKIIQGKDAMMFDTERFGVGEKTEECMQVANKTCVKIKVSYKLARFQETTNGETSERTEPMEGKTYLVDRTGNEPKVTLADGKPAPNMEAAEVAREYDNANISRTLLEALPTTVKVGDSLDNFASVLAKKELGAGAGQRASDLVYEVKVKGFGEVNGKKTVTLELKAHAQGESEMVGRMTIDMNGSVDILADGGAPVRGVFAGPITIELPDNGGRLNGNMKQLAETTYNW